MPGALLAGSSVNESVILIYKMRGGRYIGKLQDKTHEFKKAYFTWRSNAVAIAHTHPRGCEPKPSAHDRRLAGELNVPVFTITASGMYVYDPATKKTAMALIAEIAEAATFNGFSARIELLVGTGDPQETGSIAAVIHRGWMNIKAGVTGEDEVAFIFECERCEDSAVKAYDEALEENLPADVKMLVGRQFLQVKEAHDRIRSFEKAKSQTN